MYEQLDSYYREHLSRSAAGQSILGRAPEDDPNVCEEYKQILRTPGLGYTLMIEDMNDFTHPVWQWKINRKLQI
jgi:hypothetical protein